MVLVVGVASALVPGLAAPYAMIRARGEDWAAMARGTEEPAPPPGFLRAMHVPWLRHSLHTVFAVVSRRARRARARAL